MTDNIPFNKPFIAGKELYYMGQAILGGVQRMQDKRLPGTIGRTLLIARQMADIRKLRGDPISRL
ncbi:MAG: hypothetical protein LC657_07830 [Desulfobacteraceae bacterium]|nr:hypothetical protein [Desulfobacteraceae bacterium]